MYFLIYAHEPKLNRRCRAMPAAGVDAIALTHQKQNPIARDTLGGEYWGYEGMGH